MDVNESLVMRYVNVWNEPDGGVRRETIEALWTADGRHRMGAHDARGFDTLETRVSGSYERSVAIGGHRFQPAGGLQSVPGAVKFRWEMVRQDGETVAAAGVGFLVLDAAGKIVCDYLFTES